MIKRISPFLLVVALASSGLAREEYTRTFDKTLTLRPGEKLYLEHRLGDITIRTHSQPEVVIHAEIKVSASDSNQAQDVRRSDRHSCRAIVNAACHSNALPEYARVVSRDSQRVLLRPVRHNNTRHDAPGGAELIWSCIGGRVESQ